MCLHLQTRCLEEEIQMKRRELLDKLAVIREAIDDLNNKKKDASMQPSGASCEGATLQYKMPPDSTSPQITENTQTPRPSTQKKGKITEKVRKLLKLQFLHLLCDFALLFVGIWVGRGEFAFFGNFGGFSVWAHFVPWKGMRRSQDKWGTVALVFSTCLEKFQERTVLV